MFELVPLLLFSKIYIPHGHCYLWQPFLVSLHLISDALISLSYYFIPIALLRLLNERRDTPFRIVWFLFAAFIISCGTTHFLSIITLWYPIYWISGFTKALTAIISIITAFKLISIIPQILVLPSPNQLKALNQELEEKNQFLKTIYEGVEQAIFVVDILENDIFCYLSCNPAAERFFGLSTSKITGKSPAELMTPETAIWKNQQFKTCVQTGESITFEECICFQNKETWFLTTLTPLKKSAGKIKQIIGTSINIDERKQAEQKRQESEERFRSAFDHAAVGMALVSLSGQWLKVNRSVCEITGYSESELTSLTVEEITHPEDFKIDLNYAQQLVAGKIRTYQMEKRYLMKNGEIIWVLLSVSLIRDQQKTPLYFIAQIQDINATKKAEKSLRRYQHIIDATSDAICLLDQNYTYKFVNQAYLNWYYKSLDEVIGHSVSKIITKPIFERVVKSKFERCLSGETIQYERWFKDAKNHKKFMSITYTPYRESDDKISGIVVSIRNLTKFKQTEKALQKSEERLRQIAKNIPGIVYTLVTTVSGNFYFEYVSEGCREILQIEPQEIMENAQLMLAKIHPEDRYQHQKAILKSLKNLTPFYNEWRHILPSGEVRWMLGNSRPIRRKNGETVWHGVVLDISDRKQIEMALQESQERLYRTLEAGRIICWEEDLIAQTVKGWGVNIGEEWTANSWEIPLEFSSQGIYPEDRDRALKAKQNVIENGGEFQVEHRLAHFREKTWMLVKGKAVMNSQGKVTRVVGVAIDISARKATEAELVKAKEAAEVANQAKSIFLANMSHELRSPLNAILGFAQIISGSPNLTPEQQKNLNIIQHSGEHLLSLINEILDLSKIEAGKYILVEEIFSLQQLIDELQELFSLKASQKNLQLQFMTETNVPDYIKNDRLKLRQILMNLLSNAVKFTQQGHVRLTVQISPTPFSSDPSRIALQFRVSDTGVGIEPDELDHLFSPFVQTKAGIESQQGTGLGLALCDRYIQQLGGKIKVTSQPGNGTTFYFEVPVLAVENGEIPPATSPLRVIGLQPNQPDYRILIVDDEPQNHQLLEQILAPIGFELQTASNGLEAVQQWQMGHPDLILMDLKMPVLDGYAATQQIRQLEQQNSFSTPHKTIIIALTANAFNEQKQAALEAGCDDFLHKPLQVSIILNKIAEYLGVQYQEVPSQKMPILDDYAFIQQNLIHQASEWKSRLSEALLSLDCEEINQVITDLLPAEEQFVKALKKYINNFNYEPILQLLETDAEHL